MDKDEGNTEKHMKELASNIPDDDSAVYGEHLSQDKRNRIMDFVERLGKGFDKKDVDKVNSNISSMNKGALANVWDKVLFLLKRFNENIVKYTLFSDKNNTKC